MSLLKTIVSILKATLLLIIVPKLPGSLMLSRISNLLPFNLFSFIWHSPKIPVGVSTSLRYLVILLSIRYVLTSKFKLSCSTYNSFKSPALYASFTK